MQPWHWIAKTKVSGSNPINLFFFVLFDQEINSLKRIFACYFSTVLFYIGLYYYCIIIFLSYFIHFAIFYLAHFDRYESAKLSRNLQCLNRWIRPRSRSFLDKL